MSLKDIMEQRGINQSQLAEKSGVPRPNISNVVNGRREPEKMWLGTAAKLADVLDCDPREFLK